MFLGQPSCKMLWKMNQYLLQELHIKGINISCTIARGYWQPFGKFSGGVMATICNWLESVVPWEHLPKWHAKRLTFPQHLMKTLHLMLKNKINNWYFIHFSSCSIHINFSIYQSHDMVLLRRFLFLFSFPSQPSVAVLLCGCGQWVSGRSPQ